MSQNVVAVRNDQRVLSPLDRLIIEARTIKSCKTQIKQLKQAEMIVISHGVSVDTMHLDRVINTLDRDISMSIDSIKNIAVYELENSSI